MIISLFFALGFMFILGALIMVFAERKKIILERIKRSYITADSYVKGRGIGKGKDGSKNIIVKLENWLLKNNINMSIYDFIIMVIFLTSAIMIVSVFFKTGLYLFILSFIIFIILIYISVDLRGRKIIKKKEDQLEGFLIDLVTILYINPNITAAIQKAAENAENPIKKDFESVIDDTRKGVLLNDALSGMLKKNRSRLIYVVITGLIAANEKGVDLVEFLKNQIDYIREKKSLANYIRILSSGPRYTSYIIVLIPLVAMVLASILNPGFVEILLSPTGRIVLVYSAVSYLVGFYLINKVINLKEFSEKGSI